MKNKRTQVGVLLLSAIICLIMTYSEIGTIAYIKMQTSAVNNFFRPGMKYVLKYEENAGTDTVTKMPNPNPWVKWSIQDSIKAGISAEKPERENYNFVGWGESADSETPVTYTEVSLTKNNPQKTLYAIWEQAGPCRLTYYWNDNGWNKHDLPDDVFAGPEVHEHPGEYDIILQEPNWNPKPDWDPSAAPDYHTFLGWSEDPEATEATYNKNGVDGLSKIRLNKQETKLYAVWKKVEVPKPWVDYENYQMNGDGGYRIDHLNGWEWNDYIDFDASMNSGSYFEKINIPIHNLVPGVWYSIEFDEEIRDAGSYIWNPQTGTYGCTVSKDSLMGKISDTQIGFTGADVDKRYVWTYNDGNHTEYSTKGLRKITFLAEAETMYWVWDYSKLRDSQGVHLYLHNEQIEVLSTNGVEYPSEEDAYVDYVQSSLYGFNTTHYPGGNDESKYLGSNGIGTRKVFANTEEFEVQLIGTNAYELMDIPLHNLLVGQKYELSFHLDRSAKSTQLLSHDVLLGFVVSERMYTDPTASTMDQMKVLGNFCHCDNKGTEFDVTYTFTATNETMYWVWNLSKLTDGDVNVAASTSDELQTNFHVFKFTDTQLIPLEDANYVKAMKLGNNIILDGEVSIDEIEIEQDMHTNQEDTDYMTESFEPEFEEISPVIEESQYEDRPAQEFREDIESDAEEDAISTSEYELGIIELDIMRMIIPDEIQTD